MSQSRVCKKLQNVVARYATLVRVMCQDMQHESKQGMHEASECCGQVCNIGQSDV
jgi:hypothetical protein